MNIRPINARKTIFCIATPDGGAKWYYSHSYRSKALSLMKDAEGEAFEIQVPADSTPDEILALVHEAAWLRKYQVPA